MSAELWRVRNGTFSADINVEEIAALDLPQVRKLLKLAATGEDPGSVSNFVFLLSKAQLNAKAELARIKTAPLYELLDWKTYEATPARKCSSVRARLLKEQQTKIKKLEKVERLYTKFI